MVICYRIFKFLSNTIQKNVSVVMVKVSLVEKVACVLLELIFIFHFFVKI